MNIDVSHNLLINPYPPHVAERGLLKTPHPHKAVHVVYLQSLIRIGDLNLGLGIGIREWDWGLGLGIRIGD